MTRFPTQHHLISWAGLCPRLDESAGKSRSRHIRKGNPWLKVDLTQAAMAARRAKHSYLRAQFNRLAARRGVKKASPRRSSRAPISSCETPRPIVTWAPTILIGGIPATSLGAWRNASKRSDFPSSYARQRKSFLIGEGVHPSQNGTLNAVNGALSPGWI
jgi:hypothetical protein